MHARLLTNELRVTRHIMDDSLCPRCKYQDESILHTIRDCEDVKKVWNQFIHHDHWAKFFSLGLHDWIEFNLKGQNLKAPVGFWSSFFGIMVYHLWNDRNNLVFGRSSMLQTGLIY